MATIKNFTSLEQSKKLAEILPLESADMGWNVFVDDTTRILPINDWDLVKDGSGSVKFYHAWSLAALMDILPHEIICDGGSYKFKMCTDVYSSGEKYYDLGYQGVGYWLEYVDSTNLVDACVEMIVKLKEKGLL